MFHEMLRTSESTWECASCPRQVVVTRTHFQVINKGDFEARHFATVGNAIRINPVEIKRS